MERAKNEMEQDGFTLFENIYSAKETEQILQIIDEANACNTSFRKSKELFAIRRFLKEVPAVMPHIFTNPFLQLVRKLFGDKYFVSKSIYFDKPETSNWFVAYHQDLTFSIQNKAERDDFGPWSVKEGYYTVQPPLQFLENNFTVRIHLDDTNENNGCLKVIQGSHNKGIYRSETINGSIEKQISCTVNSGGLMIMRPLLMHASGRTINNQRRRVIHLEFSNCSLPEPLQWAEKIILPSL